MKHKQCMTPWPHAPHEWTGDVSEKGAIDFTTRYICEGVKK